LTHWIVIAISSHKKQSLLPNIGSAEGLFLFQGIDCHGKHIGTFYSSIEIPKAPPGFNPPQEFP
jgi:hypothetical protein